MQFKDIGFSMVRVEFHKKQEQGCYTVRRNCLMGCKCEANLYNAKTPNLQMAIDDVLCFNDSEGKGISGKGCSGRVVKNGPDAWVFEVNARISQRAS